MVDDVVLNKATSIERCVRRAREEYDKDPQTFASDLTRQDAAILNIQRVCESALDIAHYLIRKERLGNPQSAREAFDTLHQAGWFDEPLCKSLKAMIGFRNIAVHEYQRLQLPITVAIIRDHLEDFLTFTSTILKRLP